jgi:FixJ family two-component response regulator
MSHDVPVVFVVDDDVSVRESLELLVRAAGWRPKVFETAQAFLAQPRARAANCLILDLNLPDLSGLDLQALLLKERMDTPIIFLTGYADVPATVKAMKAGAVEFLTKPFSDEVLINVIQTAIERSRAVRMEEERLRVIRDNYEALSRREREVMAFVVGGRLNKQIAFDLGISEITVKAHRGHMMRKMHAHSLPDLVNMAAKLGLPH